MTLGDRLRIYLAEPIISGFGMSVLIACFGKAANADFMHSAARDILTLWVVLLAAAYALWIGLFWISNTDFGKWLAREGALNETNLSFIYTSIVLLLGSLMCILCAYLSPQHYVFQIGGEWICLFGLTTIPSMLNNTRLLLWLHTEFEKFRAKNSNLKAEGS